MTHYDIIGDVHGCYSELCALLAALGHGEHAADREPARQLVFLGDLTDRGPDSVGVLRMVMGLVEEGRAICLRGNHDDKLARKLAGRSVNVTHGLESTLVELAHEPPAFSRRVLSFLQSLESYYILDEGRLVVAHAGIKEGMIGEHSGKIHAFTLYGDTTGKFDAHGLPIRRDWAADYRGTATIVYGHTPVHAPGWVNNTINIDTGCVFGGSLTALRYPERELVSVPARKVYYERAGFGT
ncbi:MAG TPA: metallophosphoesterase [Chloroflexia bacterium]|nr:metallophosphoesterase [Chloroflexia bacterium]